MGWLDDLARDVAHPLRATWFDKFYVIAMPVCALAVVILVIAAVVRWLCA